jgi:hypothetical protein
MCKHGHAWIGRKAKAIGRYAKNHGKTRVFERSGQEPNFLMFFQCFLEVRNVLRAKFSSKYEKVLDGGDLDAVNGQDGIET